jgi:ABC-2 type transport system permease protein
MAAAQVRSVLLGYIRMPVFLALSFGLPLMFFILFGLPNVGQKLPNGTSVGAFVLASLGAYAMGNVLIYNVGIGIANQRARKLDLLQRATPLPSYVAVFANMIGGLVLGALAVALLLLLGFGGGVRMEAARWPELMLVLVFGSLPMLGLGLALGYGSGSNSAPGLASIIYLPMAFASGLFIPLKQLPDFMQKVGPFLPLYHYGQLGWNVVGAADEGFGVAVIWVAGWSIVLLGLAARLYSSDARRKFG